MLKSIIDQLRAHRDRLDAAITSLEAVEADDPETWRGIARTYQPHRAKIRPIVLGAKATIRNVRVCGRPGCGKVLGPTNHSGYCGQHWYETQRKRPLPMGQKTRGHHKIGRPGPRTAKERHLISQRMKAAWASGKFKGQSELNFPRRVPSGEAE